jgi:hypothetical protein
MNPHTHICFFELNIRIYPSLPPLFLVHSHQILIYLLLFLFLFVLCTYKSTMKMEDIPCVKKQNCTKKVLWRPHTVASKQLAISWHTTLPLQAWDLTKHSKVITSQNIKKLEPHKTT